jgi:prepilin-type N-terminal cleavage/methylation domain-containing protein
VRGVKPRLGHLSPEAARPSSPTTAGRAAASRRASRTGAIAQPLNRSTAGFTLIELLVALTLTGFVVLIAHATLAEVTDAAARGRAVARELDRAGNRQAWLLRAFVNVAVGSAPMRGFDGRDGNDGPQGREADWITFFTRIPADSGDGERSVRLWLAGDSLLAELRRPPGPRDAIPDTLVLAEGLRAFGAEFLMEYGAESPWVREWVSPVSAPIAVRLRLEGRDGRADTLLLHTGTRG